MMRVSCFRMIRATHALGYYRGVPKSSSLEPKAPALCPGLSLFSVNRRAPNRQQAPALVKWSWRPFWGCRRYDKSRPVAFPRRVGAPSKQVRDETAVDEPSLARAGRTRGARCLRLWSCVGAGSLLICRHLCSRQRSNDYRSDTTFAMKIIGSQTRGQKGRPKEGRPRLGSSDKGGAVMSGTQ